MIYSRICSKDSSTGTVVIHSDWKPNSAQFQRYIRDKNFQNSCHAKIVYYLETMNVDDIAFKPDEPRGTKRSCVETDPVADYHTEDSKTDVFEGTKRRCMDRQFN